LRRSGAILPQRPSRSLFSFTIAHKIDTRTLKIRWLLKFGSVGAVHILLDFFTYPLHLASYHNNHITGTMKLSYLLLAITTGSSVSTSSSASQVLNAFGKESYGVDVSFPVHYMNVMNKEDNPLGDRQKFYDEFMDGCREHYAGKRGSHACDITEEDRFAMSLRQPASMQVSILERERERERGSRVHLMFSAMRRRLFAF